jgi:regulator of RNase E activity RraA
VWRNRGNAWDYVVADEDGVAIAPKDRYQEVIVDAKRRRREKEALLPLLEKNGSYMKAVQESNAAKPQ